MTEPAGARARLGGVAAVADQGLSSLGSIALLVLVARRSPAESFAVFSLAYVVFTVLLGLVAAYVGQPLVLVRDPVARRQAAGDALAATAAVALALGAVAVGVGLTVGGGTARTFAALGAVLVVLLTVEVARYAFAAAREPHLALAVDATKVAVLVAVLALVPTPTPAAAVLAWGAAYVPALVVALALLARRVARPRRPFAALVARDHLGRRFATEFAVGNGSSQLTVLGLGTFGTPAAVGALRGASTVFGPLNVLLTASTSFGPPYVGRLVGARARVRAAARLGGALAVVAGLWGLTVQLLPSSVGRQVLGDTWQHAHALFPATTAQYVAMALGSAGILALRVVAPRATLAIQVVFSAATVVLVVAGYVVGGVLGAAWGLALGSALKAVALWVRAARLRGTSLPDDLAAPADRDGTAPRAATVGAGSSAADQRRI